MPRLATLAIIPLALVAVLGAACSDDDSDDTRQRYEEEARDRLNRLDDRIRDLEDQVNAGEVDDRIKDELASLKDERDDVEAKLGQIRDSSDEEWEELKADLDRELGGLDEKVNSIFEDLKDEVDGNQGGNE
jgi:chromosome segregation ATPase